MHVDVDAEPGEPAVICGCHRGDNKACVFPSIKKVEILLLKHYPLCLLFPPGPLQVWMDGWMEGWMDGQKG